MLERVSVELERTELHTRFGNLVGEVLVRTHWDAVSVGGVDELAVLFEAGRHAEPGFPLLEVAFRAVGETVAGGLFREVVFGAEQHALARGGVGVELFGALVQAEAGDVVGEVAGREPIFFFIIIINK